MYHGSDLLQQANNEVVAVIIQYRLGLFGISSPIPISISRYVIFTNPKYPGFLAGKNVKENGDLNAGLC